MYDQSARKLESMCRVSARSRGYFIRKDRQRKPDHEDFGKWHVYQGDTLLASFRNVHHMANWFLQAHK